MKFSQLLLSVIHNSIMHVLMMHEAIDIVYQLLTLDYSDLPTLVIECYQNDVK